MPLKHAQSDKGRVVMQSDLVSYRVLGLAPIELLICTPDAPPPGFARAPLSLDKCFPWPSFVFVIASLLATSGQEMDGRLLDSREHTHTHTTWQTDSDIAAISSPTGVHSSSHSR